MDVANLLISLGVEVPQFLARGSAHGLLKVAVETAPAAGSLVAELVAFVESLGAVRSAGLLVKVAEDAGEAGREAVLLVNGNGPLDSLVADRVAVGEVLCEDARAGLVFLLEVVLVLVFGVRGGGALRAGHVVDGLSGLDGYDGGAELGLVEEEGGLCSAGES